MQPSLHSVKECLKIKQIPATATKPEVCFKNLLKYFTVSLVIINLLFAQQAAAQISTPSASSGTGTNVAGVGTVAWTNPGNVLADDNAYSTVALANSASNYLQATNFGFGIPSTATISGITATIGRFESATGTGNDVRDVEVKLIQGGTVGGTNLAATGTEWPTSEGIATYGGTGNLWGRSWTPAQINAANFGVALAVNSTNSRTASVDYIKISVTYTGGTYKSSLVGINVGSTNWCAGEARTVTITIMNSGTFPWTDGVGGTPDFNVGIKWNTNGTSWTDYHVRVDAGNLAAGATGTYSIPITASNNVNGTYTTPLAAGSNNLIFDIVYEGVSWFGDNNGGVGGGSTPNAKFTSSPITISSSIPTGVSVSGGGTFCGSTTITATGGTGGTIYFQGTTSGGTSTALGGTPQTITSSGTYYFRANNGCGWGTEGSVTVTINPIPAATTVSGGGTFCGSTTITAAGGTGGTIYFQGTTSNGTSTTIPSTSQVITTSGTYYFRSQAAGCWGPQGSVVVTINNVPSAVTAAGGGTFCGSTVITATGGTNGTIYFQGTTSGGTSTALGGTPQTITTSGTYYFRANNGCGWSTEGSVTVTINPIPATTTVSGGGTFCGSTTLTAAGGTGGTIYFQGTTSNGTSTTNPSSSQVITTSGTYYFRSQAAGCWGPQGSAVVTITPLPVITSTTATPGTICSGSSSQLLTTASSSAPYNYVAISSPSPATGTAVPLSSFTSGNDDGYKLITLPFSFSFYGTPYSSTYVGTNGYITFGTSSVGNNGNTIPATDLSAPAIALCYSDLILTSGNEIETFTTGTAPFRKFVIKYNNLKFYRSGGNTGSIIGQIELNETSNIIDIFVNTVSNGSASSNKSIGVQLSGTAGTGVTGRNGSNWQVSTLEGYRFSNLTYSWSPATGLSASNIFNPIATLTNNTAAPTSTTYTVTALASTGCFSTANVNVTVNPATNITGQPLSTQTVCQSGTPTNLTVAATGTGTLGYQWYQNTINSNSGGTSISGATSATYTPSTTTTGTKYYYVIVTGTCGTATSTTAAVIVNASTVITGQPLSTQTICQSGVPTNLSVSATGTGTLTYQWYSNTSNSNTGGTIISGATSATYTPSTATAGTIYYYSIVAGSCGNVTSSTAAVIVNPTTSITTQPLSSQSVCQSGTPTNLVVSAQGTGTLTYQWYRNTTNSNSGGTIISGATPATYTPSTAIAGTIYYYAVVTGGCGNATTNTAAVTITPTPSATISYSGTPYCSGSGTATVTQTGTGGGTYSSTAGLAIDGTSGNVDLIASTSGTYTVTYTIAASGGCSIYTTSASITITAAPSATISYASSPYCSASGTATVTITGTPTNGTFSSTAGLSLNATTGAVDIGSSASGTYTVTYTVGASGGCGIYITTTTITISDNTWQGNSTNWNLPSNWSCGTVPDNMSNVLIPVTGNNPVVDGTYSVRDITITAGASLTTGAATGILTITGNTANSGTLVNSGRIILGGTTLQAFPGTGAITAMSTLEVNNTAGVSINNSFRIQGALLPTAGTINLNNSYITLSSTATDSTARVGAVGAGASFSYGTGRFVIERYFRARRAWRLMTAPVKKDLSHTIYTDWQLSGVNRPAAPAGSGEFVTGPGATAANGLDPAVNNSSSLKTYNPVSGALVAVGNTKLAALSPGTHSTTAGSAENIGYFNFVRGDRDQSLVAPFTTNTNITTLRDTGMLQTGTQTFTYPLAATAGDKFILLANPYASPVDFAQVATSNSATILPKFWAWDPNFGTVGGYVYQDATYGYVPVPDPGGHSQYLQTSQAVYVQTTKTTSAAITFQEGYKASTTYVSSLFRPLIFTTAQLKANLKFLEADNSTILADGVMAQFSSSFSNTVDQQDGLKFPNVNESFAFMRNDRLLTLERRNLLTQSDTLFFNLTKAGQRSYQLEFVAEGLEGNTAYLEDSYLKTSTPVNMSGTTTVNFSINAEAASAAANRFRLVFRPAAPLPVTFTRLKAYQQGSNINVEWTINNEVNMQAYELERSADGSHFTKIATAAALQNNGRQASYTSPDAAPFNGANYYRVHSISRSGEDLYSNVVKVTIGRGAPQISVYPNPIVNGTINLQLTNQPEGSYGVKLLNKLGQVLMTKEITHAAGSSTETLQLSKAMAHGLYQLEVTSPGKIKKNINVSY